MSPLSSGLVIDTSANGSVTTSLMYLNCPISIYGSDFGVNLIFLPLSDLNVILGMNWLEFNHVNINCYNKSVRFLDPDDDEETSFIYDSQLGELLKDEAKVFAMFAFLSVKSQTVVKGLLVVCEFPNDFSDLLPERGGFFCWSCS